MKKRIIWIATLILTGMAMAGCGDDKTMSPTQGQEEQQKQETENHNAQGPNAGGQEEQLWPSDQGHDARIDDYEFIVGGDGTIQPGSIQTMSAEEFRREIVGRGWRDTGAHEIYSDGTIEEEDYYHYTLGISSTHYFFDEQLLTMFFHNIALSASCYAKVPYQYDEETNTITDENKHQMTILSYADGQMAVLDSNDGQHPKLIFFQYMTDEELEQTRQQYNKTVEEAEQEYYN